MRTDSAPSSNRRTVVVLGVVLAGLVIASVSWLAVRARDAAPLGTQTRPFVFVLSPEHGSALSESDRETLEALLSREAEMVVEVRKAASPGEAIKSFAGAADAGILGLFEYVLANLEHGAEAELQVLREDGASTYTGDILVKSDSGLSTLKDLDGRVVAYVDRYSTSGYVFPAKLFREQGAQVKAEFAGSHRDALEWLRTGRAAAAATYTGAARDATLRSLVRTDAIPNEPVAFRRGVDRASRDRFKRAIRAVIETADGRRIFAAMADISGVRPIRDDAYEPVKSSIRAAGKEIHDVVPNGWLLERERSGIDNAP